MSRFLHTHQTNPPSSVIPLLYALRGLERVQGPGERMRVLRARCLISGQVGQMSVCACLRASVAEYGQFKIVFEAIAELMTPPEKPTRKIGFEVKEGRAEYGKGSKRKKG